MQVISASEIQSVLNWDVVIDALTAFHLGPRPIGDSFFLGHGDYGLLSRGVILPGAGAGLKIASMHAGNSRRQPPRPVEDAAFIVMDEATGGLQAILDGPEITRWKTAADSALAARRLSRADSAVLLVLGAGPVAAALVEAYLHVRPSIRHVLLWNRTLSKLDPMVSGLSGRHIEVEVVEDLAAAIARADIIATATSTAKPLIEGRYVKPGTHIDLVGGYRLDMQEADIDLMRGARIFVDDRSTAYVSGDIHIPLSTGAIGESQIEGDLYELCQSQGFSRLPDEITVYKNAGGAHLDLIVSRTVIERLMQR